MDRGDCSVLVVLRSPVTVHKFPELRTLFCFLFYIVFRGRLGLACFGVLILFHLPAMANYWWCTQTHTEIFNMYGM